MGRRSIAIGLACVLALLAAYVIFRAQAAPPPAVLPSAGSAGSAGSTDGASNPSAPPSPGEALAPSIAKLQSAVKEVEINAKAAHADINSPSRDPAALADAAVKARVALLVDFKPPVISAATLQKLAKIHALPPVDIERKALEAAQASLALAAKQAGQGLQAIQSAQKTFQAWGADTSLGDLLAADSQAASAADQVQQALDSAKSTLRGDYAAFLQQLTGAYQRFNRVPPIGLINAVSNWETRAGEAKNRADDMAAAGRILHKAALTY